MKPTCNEEIVLYGFPRSWGLPNMSPYCLKLEAYARLARIPHVRQIGDLRRAPRGQFPYARIAGEIIGDSDAIIDRLVARGHADLDASLSAHARAEQRALARMLEESTVWVLRYGRFVDAGYSDLRRFMDGILPAGLRPILRWKVRSDMKRALFLQGIGRYSRDEIYARGRQDIEVLEASLGEQPFWGGASPSRLDCTAFGFLANFLCEHARSPMTDLISSRARLVAHTERMRMAAFPEFASWVGRRTGGPVDEPIAAREPDTTVAKLLSHDRGTRPSTPAVR